jgi:hypothetical protein
MRSRRAIVHLGLALLVVAGCLVSPDPSLWQARKDRGAEAGPDGARGEAIRRDAAAEAGADVVSREGLAGERTCSPNGILATCDPLAQTGCKEGACYPAKGGFACVCPEGTIGEGSACNLTRECAPGLVCAGTSAPGVCRQVCDTAAPTCDAGSCIPLTAFPGFGYCAPGSADAGVSR